MDGPNIRFMFGTRYVRLVYRIFVFSRLFGKMSNLLDKLISKYLLLKIDGISIEVCQFFRVFDDCFR